MNPTAEPRSARITLVDGDTEELLVTPLGPNLYRVEESSLLGEVQYHDIIEVETQSDGALRFLRIATPSGLKTVSWILPDAAFESPSLAPLLERVMAVGGNWERTFGGLLMLHLPSSCESTIVNAFNAFFATIPGGSSRP